MKTFDLAIAWNWEFDGDFIHGIERECHERKISTFQVTSGNLQSVLSELQSKTIAFHALYDRASDADEKFLPLVELLSDPAIRVINPHQLVTRAIDKATMHLEFITHGLYVPSTIILPPYNVQQEIDILSVDLGRVGKPFVIKPANTTGGGTGVVLDARTMDDVYRARKMHKDDKYLLQEFIHPKDLDGKRGWFRVYSVFGETIPCWWDDQTHRYSPLSEEDERRFGLSSLRTIIQVIRSICDLDFFSSEIVFSGEDKFVVVDYVNEICDMRLQSKYPNGAPDPAVHRIEVLISLAVQEHLYKHQPGVMNDHS